MSLSVHHISQISTRTLSTTTIKLISKPILLSILSILLKTFKRIGTPSTPNFAQVNMDNLVLLSGRSICIIVFSLLIRIVLWGAVAQRLERATDNRVLTGSNPTETVWNKPVLARAPSSFA